LMYTEVRFLYMNVWLMYTEVRFLYMNVWLIRKSIIYYTLVYSLLVRNLINNA